MNLKLHHIGVASKDIEKEFSVFKNLGYKKISETFEDKIQKIKGVFIDSQNQPCLELLENLDSDGPLNPYLKKGTKFYHFAYETKNIEQDLEVLVKETKALVVVPITQAEYFEKICFLMLPNMTLIELVQER